MSELYKLVFRGEVLEGQHPAVVRKRLATALDLDQRALDKLFSGRAVVLKRAADTANAARLQTLFRKAGARLRVLPVEKDEDPADPGARDEAGDDSPSAGSPQRADAAPGAPAQPPPQVQPAATSAERSAGEGELQILPPGSAVLRDDERSAWQPREVDTGSLSLEGARFTVPEAAPAPEAPEVSHLSVADVGAELAPPREVPAPLQEAPRFDVAAPGADLAPRAAPAPPAVDFSRLSFEIAPAGADLGQRERPPPPPAPDVSHLSME